MSQSVSSLRRTVAFACAFSRHKHARICVAGAMLVCCLLCLVTSQAQSSDAPETVQTASGAVLGSAKGDVQAFKGIPFAQPPVGDLRWRAPQPMLPWSGTRQTTAYGADCMQQPFPSDAAPLGSKPAEDCLYLNVWRPKAARPDQKLPVLVWIYGGGFVNGGSSPAIYDGSRFAERGVVFVSFNYRVGRFGFFGFPELTRQNADGMLGNYGFMDQIAALQWVQRNIAAFGGNPSNVTIAGESAGGFSVHFLLTSARATGLFQQAIVESGGGRGNLTGERFLSAALPHGLPSAEQAGVAFAAGAGIDGTGSEALAALRKLPAETVRGDLNMATMQTPTYSGAMIDGALMVADPQTVYLASGAQHVPLMIGANTADLGSGQAATKEKLFSSFGVLKQRAIAAYDPAGTTDLKSLTQQIFMDRMMVEPARFVAGVFASEGLPVYQYRFGYVAESTRSEWTGAPHATEIPYVFDTVRSQDGAKVTSKDETVARTLLDYWVAFAATGNPNGGAHTTWPRYDAGDDQILQITNSGFDAGPDPWKARLAVAADTASSNAATPGR